MTKYVDMAGGINGGEDVAFFQYSTGESKEDDGQFYMTHIYIIYSEDTSCDVEAIKEHAKVPALRSQRDGDVGDQRKLVSVDRDLLA